MIESILQNSFAYILFVATLVTGVAYVYDYIKKRPLRQASIKEKEKIIDKLSRKERKELLEPKGFIGQLGSLFFVILFVFLFRSFFIEPFRIPSGSMEPTLYSGDFIAVSKLSYGIRNPLTNSELINFSKPKRGDVIVFKYPEDKRVDFIKRVVGLPGDTIIYKDKQLYIREANADKNAPAKLIEKNFTQEVEEMVFGFNETFEQYSEDLVGRTHLIQQNPRARDLPQYFYHQSFNPQGIWTVPEDCYFVLGDNRDNSKDSRYWGFVPYENIVGKTVGIWLSVEFDRDPNSVIPRWIPSSIRFNRIGGIN